MEISSAAHRLYWRFNFYWKFYCIGSRSGRAVALVEVDVVAVAVVVVDVVDGANVVVDVIVVALAPSCT